MGFLQKLFGIKKAVEREEHAVLVYLDGMGLPDNVYQECDTSDLTPLIAPVLA